MAAQTAMRRLRPTTARGPRLGVLGSVLFHGLIFATALFTFHRNFDTPQDSHVVPVDLVTIADQTNVAAQSPAPQPQKLDIPVPPAPEPPEPQMQAVEPAPEPPVPRFDIAKQKPDTDKPVDAKKNASQDFAALLNKLTTPDKPVKSAKPGQRVIQGIGIGNAMTADLSDALKSMIYRCWNVAGLVGGPNPSDLVVDYDLALNPDGSVARLSLAASSAVAAAGNAYTRAAAEAASRAIYQCQPYHLPPDRYGQWREIDPLRFDPRQMMGQ